MQSDQKNNLSGTSQKQNQKLVKFEINNSNNKTSKMKAPNLQLSEIKSLS